MTRPLKVFAVNYDGREERIVAATSQKKAAEAIGISAHCMRNWGYTVLFHRQRDKVIASGPGVVWRRLCGDLSSDRERVSNR